MIPKEAKISLQQDQPALSEQPGAPKRQKSQDLTVPMSHKTLERLSQSQLEEPPRTASRPNRSTIMSRMPITSVHIRKQTLDSSSVGVGLSRNIT